jgi:hypothetical protein
MGVRRLKRINDLRELVGSFGRRWLHREPLRMKQRGTEKKRGCQRIIRILRIEENSYAVLWVTQRNTEEEAQRTTEKKWGSLRIR